MRFRNVAVLLALTGCPWVGTDDYRENVQDADGDGVIAVRFGGRDCQDDNPEVGNCDADDDGYLSLAAGGDDCDDTSADVHPEATERCDGIDNDCDGAIDNEDPEVVPSVELWIDEDGDGEGDARRPIACQVYADPADPESGIHARNSDDCDDDDPGVNTNAEELCDGFDNNCDGAVDDVGLWLLDEDGDGYGRDGTQASGSCDLTDTTGLAAVGGDCNDADGSIHPGATEVFYDGINQNCNDLPDDWDRDLDGFVPEEHWEAAQLDNDARGFGWVLAPGDCDDARSSMNPDADEVCDGRDNDCDGTTDVEDLQQDDDDLALRAQVVQVYIDADGDGEGGTSIQICPGDRDDALHFDVASDCFDGGTPPAGFENASPEQVYSGAEEQCDGFDNNCDGNIDWDVAPFTGSSTFYDDNDDDGFGSTERFACGTDAIDGIVSEPGDCDDGDAGRFPGAPEICGNAVREDCVTEICDGDTCVPASAFDCDLDGFIGVYAGGPAVDPADADCEDEAANAFPGGTEVCDGLDNDCNGAVDADDTNVDDSVLPDWYPDLDGDGYGDDSGTTLQQCDAPAGSYALVAGDCDDTDAGENPGAPWYLDKDGDGFGSTATRAFSDSCSPPPASPQGTWVRASGDCNDTDARFHPDTLWYRDNDGDFVGSATESATFCSPPLGEQWALASIGEDCNDSDATIQGTREFWQDGDGDGYGDPDAPPTSGCGVPPAGSVDNDADCDDTDSSVNPGRTELCNALDDDCDGLVDDQDDSLTGATGPLGYQDDDDDGFGDEDVLKRFCFALPDGWVENSDDCDDASNTVNPTQTEVCGNTVDENCDGDITDPVWYEDADGDQFGSGTPSAPMCSPPAAGYVTRSGDCNDTVDTTYPGAPDAACDGIDSNCDGTIEPLLTWVYDGDGDGYGDDTTALDTCTAPSEPPVDADPDGNWVLRGGDCNDDDASTTFGRVYFVDYDVDGTGDSAATVFACPPDDPTELPTLPDGTPLSTSGGDCDDDDDAIGVATPYFTDGDGDGWGTLPSANLCPAEVTTDWSLFNGDCDDDESTVNPGVLEDTADNGVDDNCDGFVDNDTISITWYLDVDRDGFGDSTTQSNAYTPGAVTIGGDCDDGEPARHPGHPEICDGIRDNNCDGLPNDIEIDDDGDGYSECSGDPDDEDAATVPYEIDWYADADADGYGDTGSTTSSAVHPGAGWVATPGDCDDGDPTIRPGAGDATCDGIDDDCNGLADDQAPRILWYPDGDGDGFGYGGPPLFACADPMDGSVANVDDCDDDDDLVNPSQVEDTCNGIDDDCDGALDPGETDLDSDGYLACDDDCDDTESRRNPGRTEICDGVADNDCSDGPTGPYPLGERDDDFDGDGVTECEGDADDDDPGLSRPVLTWFLDGDGDGFGDSTTRVTAETRPGSGYITVAGDCDDSDDAIHPNAVDDTCDGIDDDCDNRVDDAAATFAWYPDADGDTYGAPGPITMACSAPAGHVDRLGDCDDTRSDVNEGVMVEACNGIDDDCDGLMPGEQDADRDGFLACDDCDDGSAFVYPGAPEGCDGIANDCVDPSWPSVPLDEIDADGDGFATCEGDADDGDDSVFPTDPTWFYDGDGDTFGGSIRQVSATRPGPEWVLAGADCDDADPTTHPGAADDTCNGIDENCSGLADEDVDPTDFTDFHPDIDGDGFGEQGSTPVPACFAPVGHVPDATDCDDLAPSTYPGAPELCDGVDNDCDSVAESAADIDGDGFLACEDCDDTDALVYPGAPEICDGVLNNSCTVPAAGPLADIDGDGDGDGFTECDGDPDDDDVSAVPTTYFWYVDSDGDGYGAGAATASQTPPTPDSVLVAGDCDDGESSIHPGATDTCGDGIDTDCDGQIGEDGGRTTWFFDADGDGRGRANVTVQTCTAPPGYVAFDDDCDDLDSSVYPSAPELCDGRDTDCDPATVLPFGEVDDDGDGYLSCADCAPADPRTYPNAPEVCDGVPDNACTGWSMAPLSEPEHDFDGDGYTECEGDPDDSQVSVRPATFRWYADGDGDGYGDAFIADSSSQPAPNAVVVGGDCNDADGAIHPGAVDLCGDLIDNDCDGANGNDDVLTSFYLDSDGDGQGREGSLPVHACQQPEGYAPSDTDCDDSKASVYFGAIEARDGLDTDCNGAIPSNETDDIDGDLSLAWLDCDDNDPARFPGAPELCDGKLDNDCDEDPNDDPDNDLDGDGFTECDGDTNDANAGVYPVATAWYFDGDDDGYGDGPPVFAVTAPADHVSVDGDCDDAIPTVNPGRPNDATCDGIDDDCDLLIDEDTTMLADFWPDLDGDTFGDEFGMPIQACSGTTVVGYVEGSHDDCDDVDPARNPSIADEGCNGIDDDCDGMLGATEADRDNDGALECDDDCDDDDPQMYPGNPVELCDGRDNNCDGVVDMPNPFQGTAVDPTGFEIPYVTMDTDLNGLPSVLNLGRVCNELRSPTSITFSNGDEVGLYPIDGLADLVAANDCDDGSDDIGIVVFADTDGDGVPAADGPGQVALDGCGLPFTPGYVAYDPMAGEDCAPDDPFRFYRIQDGDYIDSDGDGENSVVPYDSFYGYLPDACVGVYPTGPGLDCDDNDPSFVTNEGPSSFLPVTTSADLAHVLATCDSGNIYLASDVPLDGTPRDGAQLSFSPLNYNGDCSLYDQTGCNEGIFSLAPGSRITIYSLGLKNGLLDVPYADAALEIYDATLFESPIYSTGKVVLARTNVSVASGNTGAFIADPGANINLDQAFFQSTSQSRDGVGIEATLEAQITGSATFRSLAEGIYATDGASVNLNTSRFEDVDKGVTILTSSFPAYALFNDVDFDYVTQEAITAHGTGIDLQVYGGTARFVYGSFIDAQNDSFGNPRIQLWDYVIQEAYGGSTAGPTIRGGGGNMHLHNVEYISGDQPLLDTTAQVILENVRINSVYGYGDPLIRVSQPSATSTTWLDIDGLEGTGINDGLINAVNIGVVAENVRTSGPFYLLSSEGSPVDARFQDVEAEFVFGPLFATGPGSSLTVTNVEATEVGRLGEVQGTASFSNVDLERPGALLSAYGLGTSVFMDDGSVRQPTGADSLVYLNDATVILSNAEILDVPIHYPTFQTVGFGADLQIDRSLVWGLGGSSNLFSLNGGNASITASTLYDEGSEAMFLLGDAATVQLDRNLLHTEFPSCVAEWSGGQGVLSGSENWVVYDWQVGAACAQVPITGAAEIFDSPATPTGHANFNYTTRVPMNATVRNGWGVRSN